MRFAVFVCAWCVVRGACVAQLGDTRDGLLTFGIYVYYYQKYWGLTAECRAACAHPWARDLHTPCAE